LDSIRIALAGCNPLVGIESALRRSAMPTRILCGQPMRSFVRHLPRRRGHDPQRRGRFAAGTAWDENADPFTNAVRIIVSALRKRLGEPWIMAGVGYRIDIAPGAGRRGGNRG
jgi:hypothetical protein